MSPTICALTETWLPNDETDLRYKEVPPKGYDIISRPCPTTKKGGGVAVIYKSNLSVKVAPPTNNISEVMEHIDLTMNFKGLVVNLYVIYRFPNTSVIQFCDELSELLEENIVSDHGVLLLTGNFNIHMDNLQNPDTIIFSDFLESFGLINFVDFPTHQSRHMLDLFITHQSSIIKSVSQGEFFSDHCFINALLHLDRPMPKPKIVNYRKLKGINTTEFNKDIMDAFLFQDQPSSLSDHVHSYNMILSDALDKHAPVKTKCIWDTHHQPWFNDQIKAEIILHHKKERIWQSEQMEYAWRAFYNQRRYVANVIKTAQMSYYKNIISENRHDFKAIYKIVNSLLFRKQEVKLPPITPSTKLAENFSEFFDSKIAKIMHHLHETIDDDPDRHMYKEETFQTEMRLKKFSHVLYTDIKELVATTPNKSCKLDPIPTALLKSNIGVLALVIADIVNISLGNGKVCQDLKEALLRPLVKGNLDHNLLPSFRPVSDLSYLSKLIERVVAKQLIRYTETTNQMEPYQSAYREHFSTETALLRVKSDILEAINKKEIMCLIMLDLSAAFDSLEHSLILTHLKYRFGITDTCLEWFADYLTGRNQRVVVTDSDGVRAKSTK